MWTSDKLVTAYTWLALGAELLPAEGKKLPFGWGPRKRTIKTREEAFRFFERGNYNLGLALVRGWVAADFDNREAFDTWRSGPGAGVKTYIETTGRGAHVVWRSAGDIPSGSWPADKNPPDVAMMTGGYIVLAPSLHPSGKHYQVLEDKAPACLSLPVALAIFPFLSLPPEDPSPLLKPQYRGGPGANKIHLIKSRVSVKAELEAAGVRKWFGRGDTLTACCPWHDDRNPSLWAIPSKGVWGCNVPNCIAHPEHGAFDVINAHALRRRQTIPEAVRELWGEIR